MTASPGIRPYRYSDVVLSEWTKFRSVRSTWWTLFAGALLGVGLGALISILSANHYSTDLQDRLSWDPTQRSIASLALAQLAFAVLGVLVVTGEYSTGMIRTSLAAVPKRFRLMSAKLAVTTAASVVVAEVISFAAFSLGQALIKGKAPSASLGQHLVLRAVVGAGLYITLIALLGGGFALIFRNVAAGIAVIVAMLFILPGVFQALPSSWSQPIEEYWPTNAGRQVAQLTTGAHSLTAWWGFGEMALFVAAVLVVAFWLLEKRDA
ncbi:MAG TPA: ABC transporter permease [Acidimicrobiales bacterium]|nr:ABC transporter permease [Acidimicrobiales bacterium]